MARELPRAGYYVQISKKKGHNAFVPYPLPPDPPVNLAEPETLDLLLKAEGALSELRHLEPPTLNMQLLVDMYVRKETVLSAQIEGSQATLLNVLQYENVAPGLLQGRLFDREEGRGSLPGDDIAEGINYVETMHYGLDRLQQLPLSLRLIRELHRILMGGVRGQHKQPGEFRTTQVHLGFPGSPIEQATYIPPPPGPQMLDCLDELERFLHAEAQLPALVKTGMIHCQFEMIHPFGDGNGRIGRLLIPFYLCQQGILDQPLLYISYFFKQHRAEYYERLNAVSASGDWEGWLRFFLRGVAEVGRHALATVREVLKLYQEHREVVQSISSKHALALLDYLCQHPVITSKEIQQALGVSHPTADSLLRKFEGAGILTEMTGKKRRRQYQYHDYVQLFIEGTEPI